MSLNTQTQRILVDDYQLTWMDAFLIDRKARGLAKGTIGFYKDKLKLWSVFCEGQAVTTIDQVTPTLIREYLIYLEQTKHNPGGRAAAYAVLRAFLYWYEDETEPEGWINPIKKVKAPLGDFRDWNVITTWATAIAEELKQDK